MSLTLPRGWWGYHWSPPHPRSIVELIRAGTLDAELAGLLWLLVEGRVPIVVAARLPLAGKSTLLTALLDFLPDTAVPVVLRGATEEFGWLPEAEALGWPPHEERSASQGGGAEHGVPAEHAEPGPPSRGAAGAAGPADAASPPWHDAAVRAEPASPADPSTGVILASELSDHLPTYTWGARARVALRATNLGYGLGTTIHADSLAEVIAELSAPPISLTEDELRGLGVVLVMRPFEAHGRAIPTDGIRGELAILDPDVRRRVVAAHYVRPLERDAGGHVQRRPPAVLATWDAARDEFEHYAWGVAPELAARVGMAPPDFDREHAARTAYLEGLARDGVAERGAVAGAIETFRLGARSAGSMPKAGGAPGAYQQTRTRPNTPFLGDGLAPVPQRYPEAQ